MGKKLKRCELYDAYNVNNDYMFNAIKFDPANSPPLSNNKEIMRSESFYGPFTNVNNTKTTHFFFSLARAMAYDVEKYQYDSIEDAIYEGHVFGLFTAPLNHEHVTNSHSDEKAYRHYLKYNLGSLMDEMDLSEIYNGKITFKFSKGDYCDTDGSAKENEPDNENAANRYSSTVTLICDKKVDSLNNVEVLPSSDRIFIEIRIIKDCHYDLVWRTPYACSQCKNSESKQELVFLKIKKEYKGKMCKWTEKNKYD